MGKDKRDIYRGRCMRCPCSEYVAHTSPENHTCGYCECAPTQHEEISLSPTAAKAYHHQGKVPYPTYQTLSPHPGQLHDKRVAQKEHYYNGRGPNSQEQLYARKNGSQEQDSDPSHPHTNEPVPEGRSSRYFGKEPYSFQNTCGGNFEEDEPDLYSTDPPDSDSGHGTGMEPSTPTATTKQFQKGSPYSSSMLYQNQNLLHGSPTSHTHRGYYGRPQGEFHGTKQYNDKYTRGSHVHQQHQPQPSATYPNQQRRSLYKERPAVKQQHSDSAQHQGEHLANQQRYGVKSSILEQQYVPNQQYAGHVSNKTGNECGRSPSSPYLQERQRKQEEFMHDKSVPYQPSDTYDPQCHNTLSVHYQQLHRERSNGTQLHDSTLPNESCPSQNSGNTQSGSPNTYQEPVLQGESLTGSAQYYDSSQSYSPHISHTSPEGGKDIMAKMKHLHQKLRKLEEAQTSVKRELQNIITGVINLPVSEIEMYGVASMELLPVQANHSDNLVQLLPTCKEPLKMVPGGFVQEKKLMEAKLKSSSWQNPLIMGADVSKGQQIGSNLGGPLHSIEQGLQPVAKPLVNYNSDTDGNNQSGVEDISGSEKHSIGASYSPIVVECSEQYMQQVSKLEDNNFDSNGNKQSPPGQNQLDQHVDVSQDQEGSLSLEPRLLPNPKDSPQLIGKPSDLDSNKESDENGGMVHVDKTPAKRDFESTSKQTSENETESRQDDGSGLDSIPSHTSEQPVVESLGDHFDTYESEQSVHDHLNLLLAKQPPQEDITGGVLREEGSSLGSTLCPSSVQHTQKVTNLEDSNSNSNNTHGSLCAERNSMETEIESPDKQNPVDEVNMSGGQQTDSNLRSTPLHNTEQSLQSMAYTDRNGLGQVKENLIQTEVESPRESPGDLTEEASRQHPLSAERSTPCYESNQALQPVVQLKDGDSGMMTGSGVSHVDSLNVTDGHSTSIPNSSQGTKLQLPTSVSDSETEEYFSASGSEMEMDDDMHLLYAGVLQDKAVLISEVSRTQDVLSSEGLTKQDEPVSSPEVPRKQDEPVSSPEVSKKPEVPLKSSEESKKTMGSVSSSALSMIEGKPISGSKVSREKEASASSSEVSRKQEVIVSSSKESRNQDGPVSSSEVSWKQDEAVSCSEVSSKQGEAVSSPEVSGKQDEAVLRSEESKEQDEPVSSSERPRMQEASGLSSEVLRENNEPVSSSEMSRKEDRSVSSPAVPSLMVSIEQDVKGSSAQAPRRQGTPVSTSDQSRGQSVSVSNTGELEEQGVPIFNTKTARKSVSVYSSMTVNTLSSDCGRWKDQHDTFHPKIHGKNIKIENDGTTARRDQLYTDGICFSKFPIKMGCNIHLKIVESKKFRGSMRIGFTSNNPEDMSVESLPAHSYPEVQQGFWIKPLHDKLAQQGYVVTYMVDSSGDVFYSINGEEKGLFFSGVDVSCRLWAAVDIHGSTIAVQFANDQVVSDAVSRNIHEGDQVMLQVKTVETLQLLQEGHGGMQRDLEKAIRDPSMGVAIRIDDDEDVRVFYKKHNRVWCINPAALRKVGTADLSGIIREGDLVAIGNDLERIRQLQKDHGEWVETMERTLGKIGRVTKITHQGDLRLRVDGKTWNYNAKAVTKITMKKGVSGTSKHSVNCDKGLHYWKSGVAKVCTRCGECTANGADCNLRGSPFRSRGSPCGCREKTGGCADCGMCHSCAGETDDETDRKGSKMARLLRMLKRHVGEDDDSDEEEAHVIAVGDKVRVTTDAQTLPMLQREGGLEWDEAMLQVIGKDGRATQVSAKSVTVHFPHHGRWSLVPGCLTKVCVRVKQRGGEAYQKGELVRIITDGRQLKRIQSKHGGYSRDMAAALGKTGCVMRCKDGSVKVDVTGMSWWFNPAALSRAVLKGRESLDGLHIKDGDYVRVDVDAETFKTNQVCHGGYVDRMEKSVEDFGVVHHIDIDGDAVVCYPDGTRWCINAMSLGKVDPAECGQIDVSCVLEVADWVKVEDDKDRIKRVQEKTDCIRWQEGYFKAAGKVGQVRTTYPFNDVIMVQIEGSGYPLNPKLLRRASPADLKEVLGSGDITNPGFTRGDLVKIAVDTNKLRVLQDGHGGFVDKMDELLELVGSVSFIDRDGDVYVRFSIRRLCFNPYSLAKVTPEEDTFHVGDLVLIEPDQERFKDLQRPTKHGRYNQKMLPACGKVGRLLNVLDRDRVRVKVLGRNWMLNPQLVTRMGNPGLGTGDWKSAAICAPNKHDWSTGRCLVCVKCGECTHYGRLCPARDKPGRYPGSICGCGNGHAGCDDCGSCRSCAGEIQIHEDVESDGKDAHEMGWQGWDAMEKLGVGERQPTSSEKAAAHKVISAVLKKMTQAVEQLKKSETKQSADAASITTILENNLLSPFTKYVSSTHRKLMGDHLANIDAARVLLDQYLKCVPAEDIRERDEETRLQFECLQLLRKLLVHGTNSSPEFCRTVGRCNLLATLLQDLSSFHKRATDDTTWPSIHSIITILYNCARVPENQDYIASCNVVSVLTPYLRSKDEGIRIIALSCLAFIIEEENLHLIRLNVDMAELIVSLLKDALGTPEHSTTRGGNKYSALQMATIISVIVRNDENKQILVAKGMMDLLIRLIQTGDDGEKEAALLCIRRLADSDVISGIIRRETKVRELLLPMRKDRNVSKVVRDAVTMTVDVLENGPPQETKATAGAGSISTIKVNDLLVDTKRPLGGGGFGVVFRGYHRRWMMNVAVKKLKSLPKEQSLSVSEALIEEANFMRRAQNAYRFIVPLYGVCVDENLTALVMDYMENGSVWDLMCRVKHVPWWALKWRILHETILGMNFLHSLDPQIIHRDLKSQNIMLDEDFHAKISDFGLSKYKHLASKSQGTEVCLAGTITHIPPEYLVDMHLKAGEKFDVYSFGILIWEILTGQEPYQNGQNSAHIRLGVINGQRPDKKAIPKVGPNELSFFTTLMEECWSTCPGERPPFRDVGERVQIVMQRTNVQVAEAVHAVRTALGKEEKGHEETQVFAADDGPDA
ncbi:uncharacterized protein LOC144881242 [Branchiostoma floridae x Branchiostoma japonicum]